MSEYISMPQLHHVTLDLGKQCIIPCVIIPCYNHGDKVGGVLERLERFKLPVILVDDGSNQHTKEHLKEVAKKYSNLTLKILSQNTGKGGAVLSGIRQAHKMGYTHAIQVDADEQHHIEDISKLLEIATLNPKLLISGWPRYDKSIPKIRFYGRYITHFWVWIETLSFSIKDSMCGFRVYPVAPVMQLLEDHVHIGKRMDFDTEIMVKLYWMGTASLFVKTNVVYPEGGISHFNPLLDNLRISIMHCRLCLGMLARIPRLFVFNVKNRKRDHQIGLSQHWAKMRECKGLRGMHFMLLVYRIFGRRFFNLLLYPVVAIFYLTQKEQRQASQQFLVRAKNRAFQASIPWEKSVNSYRHMWRFAEAMLDKIASWQGKIYWGEGKDVYWAEDSPVKLSFDQAQGYLFLVSHLGDIEVCRALSQKFDTFTVNALVFNEHAQLFKKIMQQYAPNAAVNLIAVDKIGPHTAVILENKLSQGECVAIVGDRIATSQPRQESGRRITWAYFLGDQAPFAQGPFILAALLKCPVYLLFALKKGGQLRIYCEEFSQQLVLPRASRDAVLQKYIDQYAKRLEYYSLNYPLDWFNFFDFWCLPQQDESRQEKVDKE